MWLQEAVAHVLSRNSASQVQGSYEYCTKDSHIVSLTLNLTFTPCSDRVGFGCCYILWRFLTIQLPFFSFFFSMVNVMVRVGSKKERRIHVR